MHVLPDDIWVKAKEGETIWEALQRTDVVLEGECGGLGKCGKCKVKILSLIDAPTEEERELLDEEELKQGIKTRRTSRTICMHPSTLTEEYVTPRGAGYGRD